MRDEIEIAEKINSTILFDKYDDYTKGYIEALKWVIEDNIKEVNNGKIESMSFLRKR